MLTCPFVNLHLKQEAERFRVLLKRKYFRVAAILPLLLKRDGAWTVHNNVLWLGELCSFRNVLVPDGQLLYWYYCCTLCNLCSFCCYNIYLLNICRWWIVVFLSVIILSVLLSIVFEWKWNYTRVVQCLSPFVNFHCVTYWWWVPHVQMSQEKATSVVKTCSCFLLITWVQQELRNIDMFF